MLVLPMIQLMITCEKKAVTSLLLLLVYLRVHNAAPSTVAAAYMVEEYGHQSRSSQYISASYSEYQTQPPLVDCTAYNYTGK